MAGDDDSLRRASAFEAVVATYYPVLLRYLKGHFRLSEVEAEDCMQGFVLDKLMKRQIIQQASSEKGKFRYFLMRSLERYVLDLMRRKSAAKRAPNERTVSFEVLMEGSDNEQTTAEHCAAFDVEFAQFVVGRALRRMQERCEVSNQPKVWALFKEKFLGVAFEGTKPLPNDTVVRLLDLKGKREVFTLMAKAKGLYAEVFREVLAEFVGKEQVDEEMDSLRHVLRSGS